MSCAIPANSNGKSHFTLYLERENGKKVIGFDFDISVTGNPGNTRTV